MGNLLLRWDWEGGEFLLVEPLLAVDSAFHHTPSIETW